MNFKNLVKLIALLILLAPFSATGQEDRPVWDYPIKPGMEEWKQLQSNEEKVNACQIPDSILSSLSTEELTNLCLKYPLLYDVFAFENLNSGLDKLLSDFNGIRELYKRKDVSIGLLKRYIEKIESLSFLEGEESDLEKGYFIISTSTLEVLLSQISEDKDCSKKILQSLVAGYEGKLKYADYFKGFGFRMNFYSRSHIIAKMDSSFVEQLSQKERNIAFFSGMVDEQTINLINEFSNQLIK